MLHRNMKALGSGFCGFTWNPYGPAVTDTVGAVFALSCCP